MTQLQPHSIEVRQCARHGFAEFPLRKNTFFHNVLFLWQLKIKNKIKVNEKS